MHRIDPYVGLTAAISAQLRPWLAECAGTR